MAESFPAFLRSLEKSIEPLEGIAGVAPPFRDEDDVAGGGRRKAEIAWHGRDYSPGQTT